MGTKKKSTVFIREWGSYMLHLFVLIVFVYMLLLFQPRTLEVSFPKEMWFRQIGLFLSWTAIFYLNMFWSVPRFLMNRRYTVYFLFTFTFFLLPLGIYSYFEYYLDVAEAVEKISYPQGRPYGQYLDKTLLVAAANILVLGLSTSLTVVVHWFRSRFREEKLKAEHARIELELLKEQINPHFLLNTLHAINALIQKKDMEQAEDATYRLSTLLKTLLYHSGDERISLTEEIRFIEDYVHIMRMRTSAKHSIELKIHVDNKDVFVAPMIFLPFIENAFKHGVNNNFPSYISIVIVQDGTQLTFDIKNSLHPSGFNNGIFETGGIGLSNTLRRLELLYNGKYGIKMDADQENGEYRVHIKIDTSIE